MNQQNLKTVIWASPDKQDVIGEMFHLNFEVEQFKSNLTNDRNHMQQIWYRKEIDFMLMNHIVHNTKGLILHPVADKSISPFCQTVTGVSTIGWRLVLLNIL